MKRLSILFLAALSTGMAGTACAEGGPLAIKSYLDAMKQLSRTCSMSYNATCLYPDKTRTAVSGRLAISGQNYYDSSNTRFVLMNSKWLVVADHQPQLLNIVYLPDWRKKMGTGIDLDISGYLLADANMEDFSGFKVSAVGQDSFKVVVDYKLDEGQVINLILHYAKGAVVPASYEGEITYSMKDEDSEPAGQRPEMAKVRFECRDITRVVDAGLFDDSRLIRVAGGKAQMKRYNNYKIYRKTS